MLEFRNPGGARSMRRPKAAPGSRARRVKRQFDLEPLEVRTLLSYVFSYDSGTQTATATGTAAVNSLVIEPVSGFLEYSVNSGAFSGDWGGLSVPAAPTVTVDINLSTDDGATLTLGTPTGPASDLLASFSVVAPSNTSDSVTIDDSLGTTLASGIHPYAIDTGSGTISGPGFNYDESSSDVFGGGVTLEGSSVDGDIYNVLSVDTGEPFNLVTGASGTSTINVGSAGIGGVNDATLAITSAGGTSTVNIDDSSDTTNGTITLDDSSGNGSAPNEVTGMGGSPIEYDSSVTALNITGGTDGADGVTFAINNTQSVTTTTISGGANQNFFNLSNPTQVDGIDNVAGPMVVQGGSSLTDVVTLEDSDTNHNNDYTVTSTTVTRDFFGGLTYDDNIGTLTLNAENTLATKGNNTITISSTADTVTTNINGQQGVNTVDVESTGTGGTLNISEGTDDGSTINVITDSEPVNISLGNFGTSDSVNIGSTGGDGTMAGILGAIGIIDGTGFYDLTFHDESDTTPQTWTLNDDDSNGTHGTATVALGNGIATTTFHPGDLYPQTPFGLTINGGSGGNTFDVINATGEVPVELNTGSGDDTVNVYAAGDADLVINGQAGDDTVTLGASITAPLGMQGLTGDITVGNASGSTALILDDSEDTAGQAASMTDDGTTGTVTGLTPATIYYTEADISSLTVNGGSGGNTFDIDGTLVDSSFDPTPTTLNTGTGDNTVDITATSLGSTLAIQGQGGDDSVNVGMGSLANINGPIGVSNVAPGVTDLTLDGSADTSSHELGLSSSGAGSTVHDTLGDMPADVEYETAILGVLTIDTNAVGGQSLSVDFSGGNPISPIDGTGLVFNAGADSTSTPDSHVLNLTGTLPSGAFASETHNAEDSNVGVAPHFGDIAFTDQDAIDTGLDYTGLQPINDTAPATLYTFNDLGYPDQSFSATDGGAGTMVFTSTPTPATPTNFETTTISNKTNVVFNTPSIIPIFPGDGLNGVVDLPTASTGLASLTFNTNTNADNAVSFLATPAGVVTTLNGSTDEDLTNVTGLGIASGTTLSLDGGPSTNVLNYDAGGQTPTITAGGQPGEVLISIPAAGTVDAFNYQQININDTAAVTPVAGAPVTINTIEGFQVVDALVGTVTFPLASLFPPGTVLPAGLTASDFTATIDWGDGTVMAGTVVQDASDPSVYDIEGTHIYTDPGTFPVTATVNLAGGTITGSVNGTPITMTLPVAPLAGTSVGLTGSADVGSASLAVSAYPIVGTEGVTIASAPIASFIDAGGASGTADPASNFQATIVVSNSEGVAVISVPAVDVTIVQNSSSNSYSVIAPAMTLPDEGTYQVLVTVSRIVPLEPTVMAQGGSTLVVADAPLTAGPTVNLFPSTGNTLSSVVVGTFTDAYTAAPAGDFTAVIDWGDGSPTSLGTIVPTGGGGFSIFGDHAYAKPGSYVIITNVADVGGSTVTLTGTASVTDAPVTGAVSSFTSEEGQSTGTIVLATFSDLNLLATASSVTAFVPIGGWSDGTPLAPVTLTVIPIGGTGSATLFEVTGSHTYADEGSFPVSISVTTSGGVTTDLTAGTATVLDAPLSSSNGTTITSVEGSSTGTVLLGSFADANQGATVADFTSGGGSVVVTWGDGSAPQTLAAGDLTLIGSPNGVVFDINASHTYADEGRYAITIAVTDAGGSTATIASTALVADAPLTAVGSQPPLSPHTGIALNSLSAIAEFTDANPSATTSDYSTVIDWGDGSPNSLGVVYQTGGVFSVTGPHTYADPGTYDIIVNVTDDGGSTVTLTNTATVTDLAVTGTVSSFTAEEGQSTGTIVLATFSDPNLLATASNVTAFVPADGWGDGSPASPVTLTVTQVGGTGSATLFEVTGSHTYADEGSFPVSISVTTSGGVTTDLTAGTATVLDAPLSSSNGTTIKGIEGNITGSVLLGSFVDANQGATVADFTSGGGSVVVNWGDSSAPQTLNSSNLTLSGSPDGVVFNLKAEHTYADEGQYPITLTVTDDGGSTATIASTALIADAALKVSASQPTVSTTEAAVFPIPEFATPAFSGAVGSFTDGDPTGAIGDFTATIDWGDGTSPSAGTISQPGGVGTAFLVSGSHTYADAGANGGVGTYPIQVFVTDVGGSTLTVSNTASVADRPIVLTGAVSPASMTGLATGSSDVTSNAQPVFYGTSEAFSHVSLFATPTGGGASIAIGTTQAQGNGAWNLTSTVALPTGTYTITATATDQFGHTTTTAPVTIMPRLVVDTVAPVITGLTFDRFDATLTVTFQDNLSGMDLATLENGAFYHLSAKPLAKDVHVLPLILPTSITVTPGATPSDPVVATVVFHHGKNLRGGLYTVVIDSGSGDSGIEDNAANALDGEFYGSFPSGDGRPGGNFEALIATYHDLVKPYVPSKDGHVSPSLAVDPPAGAAAAVESGPIGIHKPGKPVHTIGPESAAIVKHPAKDIVRQSVSRGKHVFDEAIEGLVHEVGTRARRR